MDLSFFIAMSLLLIFVTLTTINIYYYSINNFLHKNYYWLLFLKFNIYFIDFLILLLNSFATYISSFELYVLIVVTQIFILILTI